MTKNKIYCGYNLQVVVHWPSNSISAVLTDPPYGLEFMGKDWDKGLPGIRFWREFLRITKPGGFLLCFGGTRTYHRLTCAIEDAGWQIRDCMMYLYGTGFPKGHNYAYQIHKKAESEAKHDLRFVRKIYLSKAIYACKECGQVLLTSLSEQDAPQLWKAWAKSKIAGGEQSCVEGWSHLETPEGELQRCPICSMSHRIFADGSEGQIHNGTPIGNGKTSESVIKTSRGSTSYRPQSKQQSNKEPYAVFLERLAQAHRGNSTALKPAWEPIIVAMKPIDGTFAHNAEKHGVAGLNIDGSRIGTKMITSHMRTDTGIYGKYAGGKDTIHQGRWPANLILDEEAGAEAGEWKRYFYCAKTSRKERNMGMENCEDKLLARSGGAQGAENRGEDKYLQNHIGLNRVAKVKNNHPTVKPLALMKYLCTLLKMPSADQIILDPFLGSGTTGIACKELGIDFIGIEKEKEYCEIAVKRIAAVEGQEITLETTLPVSKHLKMHVPGNCSQVIRQARDCQPSGGNENLPQNAEHRQSIIAAANASLRKNQK